MWWLSARRAVWAVCLAVTPASACHERTLPAPLQALGMCPRHLIAMLTSIICEDTTKKKKIMQGYPVLACAFLQRRM